ncbi:MAG: tandem-95 repeat protein [Alphaproteobacteria bacterium]|nr:tandem-95 repeat protein [Alphaproteobacteria bacterium]
MLPAEGGDGSLGFIAKRIIDGDYTGYSAASAGDFNGDGFDDLIIGAKGAEPNGVKSGQSHIVFGSSSGLPALLELSALNGTNDFLLTGNNNDLVGHSVSGAGDINGDGLDDVIIGAPEGSDFAGRSYVVFGKESNIDAALELSSLDGINGFILTGIHKHDAAGWSVNGGGDVNGDGIDDLIIGAKYADPNGNNLSGQAYVVFGSKNSFPASLNLSSLNGTNGFTLNGITTHDRAGSSVDLGGDLNADGFDDIVIGAPFAIRDGTHFQGQTYVVFGNSSFDSTPTFELSALDGSNGFIINGAVPWGWSGYRVNTGGDFNGDTIDDLIIDARFVEEAYVVFGSNDFPENQTFELSSLDGKNGFVLEGNLEDPDWAGDVNGDGFDDIVSGTNFVNGYVVFGSSDVPATLDASGRDGSNGFHVFGPHINDVSGGGDINGDGVDDLIFGAPFNSYLNRNYGVTFVLFGRRAPDAVDNSFTTNEDTAAVINPVANDEDKDGDPLSIHSFDSSGLQGTLVENSDGTFRYDPNGRFETLNTGDSATDTFTYEVSDGRAGFDTATVVVAITGVNDAPEAMADMASTDEDTEITTGNVLLNDTDVDNPRSDLSVISLDTTGTRGLVVYNGDGTFTYDPNGQFEGLDEGGSDTDSFSYTVSDGNADDTATVTVTITGADEGPDEGLLVTILDDNTDPDGQVTLREALAYAKTLPDAPDTPIITFADNLTGGTITLGSQLDVSSSVTIDGHIDNDGIPDITIDANADGDDDPTTWVDDSSNIVAPRRVFEIAEDLTVTLDGLRITGGATDGDFESGGGVRVGSNAVVTIMNSTIYGNSASGHGGGISAKGNLAITNSAVENNSANFDGGGIFVDSLGDINIDSSTISGNYSGQGIGGIHISALLGYPDDVINVKITNSQIFKNNGGTHHPSVFVLHRGGSGRALSMRRAMRRSPLVKNDVLDRATFFG